MHNTGFRKHHIDGLQSMSHQSQFTPRTREQIKADFAALGITLSQWARENGFDRTTVYAVINGYSRGSYGNAHAIAVALGMKAPPDELPLRRKYRIRG